MIRLLGAILLASCAAAPRVDARMCQTPRYICATDRPFDGYCECVVSHGVTEAAQWSPCAPTNISPGHSRAREKLTCRSASAAAFASLLAST